MKTAVKAKAMGQKQSGLVERAKSSLEETRMGAGQVNPGRLTTGTGTAVSLSAM